MKILAWVLGVLVALVLVLFLGAFLLPATVHVERSTVIEASPQTVFGMVNDLRESNKWSPWANIDPDTEYRFSGPASGVGARMEWSSDHPDVGNGSQEITASEPNELVRIHLDFGAQGVADSYFELKPEGSGTAVVWGFDTEFRGFVLLRYLGLMMDGLVGSKYEEGLATLKEQAEAANQSI